MNQVLIFTHIPKTAGTSLRYHFQKHLKDQEEFIHLANKGRKMAAQQGLLPFQDRSETQRNLAKVILGHDVNINTASLLTQKNPFRIVYFRDPIAWEISRYNQYANAKLFKNAAFLKYPEWMMHEETHSQFDWFLKNYCLLTNIPENQSNKLKLILDWLEKMNWVGFVDQLNNDMAPFFKALGIPTEMKSENVTGRFKKQNIFMDDESNLELLKEKITPEFDFFKKIRKKYDRKLI